MLLVLLWQYGGVSRFFSVLLLTSPPAPHQHKQIHKTSSFLPREEVMAGFVEKFKQFHTKFMEEYGPHHTSNNKSDNKNGNGKA